MSLTSSSVIRVRTPINKMDCKKSLRVEDDPTSEIQMTSTPKPTQLASVAESGHSEDLSSVSTRASSRPVTVSTLFEQDSVAKLDQTTPNSSIVKDREGFKNEFCSLNHKLGAYMQKVKGNELKLEESEKVRKSLEEHLKQFREKTSQQIAMLRSEVEQHVRQAVEAKETISQLQKDIQHSKRDNDILQGELNNKRQREINLERMLVFETNTVRRLHEENSKLRDQLEKEEKDRNDLSSQLTRLKVDNATLHERVKIVTFERTMMESKMIEADKKLQFSTEDVDKKITAERNRLEKLALEKLEEVRQKHEADIERLKKEHNKKIQDTLLTYVSAEDYARLETRQQETLKRAEDAEVLLAQRQELLDKVRADSETLQAIKDKELATERHRSEKLNKRLIAQRQSYEDIRQELQTYRQLIDSLDIDSETLANTPLGAKRHKMSLEAPSTSGLNQTVLKSKDATPAALKGRQVLLRRALTPNRTPRTKRTVGPSIGSSNDSASDVKTDCKVM
ncbi:paramyosin-like isoform X1 [Varroa destructor]|uniref:Uncharacterized protein n=2 Tax=Varroa destructor TaxID=109461 RepID=A0A7M7IZK5_VARDE|nr:paramyosin-like isoform X1 [Varroa destructor]